MANKCRDCRFEFDNPQALSAHIAESWCNRCNRCTALTGAEPVELPNHPGVVICSNCVEELYDREIAGNVEKEKGA